MLGVGDFYYELGVQIIEVCLATSHRNGGKQHWNYLFIMKGHAVCAMSFIIVNSVKWIMSLENLSCVIKYLRYQNQG